MTWKFKDKETAMFHDDHGPIERFEWGKFTITGRVHMKGMGVGKDIRLVGTDVTEWAEREGHLLTPEMITGIYHSGIEVLVIGNGINQLLQCPDTVRTDILSHGIMELHVLPTPEACKDYNELYRQGRKVALLAHGTC
jgi:hypothetical protein